MVIMTMYASIWNLGTATSDDLNAYGVVSRSTISYKKFIRALDEEIERERKGEKERVERSILFIQFWEKDDKEC